jgi:hypothetical protein
MHDNEDLRAKTVKNNAHLLNRLIFANLGHCPYCMSKAFQVGLIASALFFSAMIVGLTSSIVLSTGLVAVGFTGLWIAHLVAFAFRASTSECWAEHASLARRGFLLSFGRALTFSAVLAATPVFAAARHRTSSGTYFEKAKKYVRGKASIVGGCPPDYPIDCGAYCCRRGRACGTAGNYCFGPGC